MASGTFTFRQFTVHQEHAAMKVGTDSDLLGALGAGGHTVLDIGTGTGVLSLMLAQRFPDARITAIDIDDDAVLDAGRNFSESRFADRIELLHISFQDFLRKNSRPYDCIICNPPYFDRSLECPDGGRNRARHTSSLPFDVLARGVSELLEPHGVFSVILPPEVLQNLGNQCRYAGLALKECYRVKSLPEKPPKRYILVYEKSDAVQTQTFTCSMRNEDHSWSVWYKELMKEFLLPGGLE